MTDNNPPQQEQDTSQALVQVLTQLTETQVKDTEVRRHELLVRSQEIESNERIALKSIEAQERNHADHRSQYNRHLIHRYIFVIIALLIVAAFAVVMTLNGAKDIVVETFKILLAFAGGAYGGFHAGKAKKDKEQ